MWRHTKYYSHDPEDVMTEIAKKRRALGITPDVNNYLPQFQIKPKKKYECVDGEMFSIEDGERKKVVFDIETKKNFSY